MPVGREELIARLAIPRLGSSWLVCNDADENADQARFPSLQRHPNDLGDGAHRHGLQAIDLWPLSAPRVGHQGAREAELNGLAQSSFDLAHAPQFAGEPDLPKHDQVGVDGPIAKAGCYGRGDGQVNRWLADVQPSDHVLGAIEK